MRSVFRYRELIRNLVLKDLKLKYRDSVLGFLWSLANPLLLILVYSFVFGHLFPGGPPNFAYFLMVGILPWNFFAQSVMMSTSLIIDNGNLLIVRKVALPMEAFPSPHCFVIASMVITTHDEFGTVTSFAARCFFLRT
jgi:lipopolysaccharide transport system permease protein